MCAGPRRPRVAANVYKFWRRTDGHDRKLITHRFSRQAGEFPCQPLGQVDHGQNWHCLRLPTPAGAATPSIPVDLPLCERKASDTDPDLNVPHGRFLLAPLASEDRAQLMWVFQVGKELIEDHNDIFNSKAAALITRSHPDLPPWTGQEQSPTSSGLPARRAVSLLAPSSFQPTSRDHQRNDGASALVRWRSAP